MSYFDNVLNTEKFGAGDYTNWDFDESEKKGYVFDSSLSPKYRGRFTTSFEMDNGLLARILVANGPFKLRGAWHNLKNSTNVHVIENAYLISKSLKKTNDWRINVPDPKGLYLVKARPLESLHPAFVMDYIQNDFFDLSEKEKSEKIIIRDHMLEATKEHGFIPSDSAKDVNNFLYNKFNNKVYLIGFGLWERK